MNEHPPKGDSSTSPSSRLSELADNYDVILSDVWGVVHNGITHTPAAADALIRYRAGGGVVILITNAPRPGKLVRELLDSFGLPRSAYDDVVSSGDITVDMIVARGTAQLHHIGPSRDLPVFEAVALRTGIMPKSVAVDAAGYVVCTGLFHDSDKPDAYEPRLRAMAARNLPVICANPDIVVHVGDDLLWCAGALAEHYTKMGGEVIMAGKPHAVIYETAMARARAIRGKTPGPARILAIGDAFHTDMRGAKNLGLDSLFISSGIHRDHLHPRDDREMEWAPYVQLQAETGITPRFHSPHLLW